MDQNSNLIHQIFQILSQLEESYQKYQRIDENLKNKLYEMLKFLPNCDEIIEEFERIFSLSYDENDINLKGEGHEKEIIRKSIKPDPKSSQETKKSSNDVQESLSKNQQNGSSEATKSKATVKVVTPIKIPSTPKTEKERKQTCVELFADFGSFFNQSLSKVGFKYCTETEIVRRQDEHHE